ncbi:MAG: ankyrin repeat domain-containing protein [Myxococcales bacterium]|nr:ankyrin repeat domain-containing protein [Myxococcales bacterium]MCB9644333.1 ankyrin repeat domain-containing protein [Myxococcales bacterium]
MDRLALGIQLLSACQQGELEEVKKLLQTGADVNFTDVLHGYHPLDHAIRIRSLALVMLLVESGADVNRASSRVGGLFPLQFAVYLGEIRIVDFLLRKGATLCDDLFSFVEEGFRDGAFENPEDVETMEQLIRNL